jgi:uncharacterized protein (TIRG00374 family)
MATAMRGWSEGIRVLLSAVLAVVLLTVLVFSLDTAAISAALLDADWSRLALAAGCALFAQLCWNLMTVWILRTADDSLPRTRLLLAALAGTFGKLVLPLGNLGGAAVLAYAISEGVDGRFRDVFPPVSASELLRFGGSLAVATVGLVGLALRPVSGFQGPYVVVLLSTLAVGLFAGGVTVAYRRERLGRLVQQFASVLHAVLGMFSRRLSSRLAPESVASAVQSFLESFDRATANRRRLAVAGTLGLAGWLAFGLALTLSFAAVGVTLPLALALFVAPASGLATLLPTPGGLGSSEVALTAVFVLLSVASPELATAAVLLYRLVTYWLVVAVGGLASVYLSMSVWQALE